MLKAHLDAVERSLLAISQVPANAGHMLHRGTPREAFIKEFLIGHLSARLAVGTGEIIDAISLPREPRNQFDIIIYKADYPKIDIGGGISAFFAESVVATIEVKSLLTEAELDVAINNAANAKRLQRNLVTAFTSGYVPPGILSYVISYAGPAQISTVYNWQLRSEAARGLNQQPLPPTGDARLGVLSESVEGVFCLGLGSIIFDNTVVSIVDDGFRARFPNAKRQIINSIDGNLLMFFLMLSEAGANANGQWANLTSYLGPQPFQASFEP